MLPVLIGALAGYLVALPLGLVDFGDVRSAAWFAVPNFTLPDFGHPQTWVDASGAASRVSVQ